MALQPNEVSTAITAVAAHVPDSLEKSIMWVSGILAALGLGRKGAMTVMKVHDDIKIHNTMHEQLEIVKQELKEARERMHGMGEKLGALRDIELAGAKDVASIGIWVNILEERTCPCIELKTCCAIRPIENLSAIYARIEGRRRDKETIFAEPEVATAKPKRKTAVPSEATQ